MSRIRTNLITNRMANGAPTVSNGLVISGVTTSTTFSGSGASLTNLNASNIASGTVPTARLGSGTANSSTFLRGDSTFATVTSTTINNNADNRVITGSGTANTLNGESGLTYDGTVLSSDQIRYASGGNKYNGHPRSVVIGYSGSNYANLGMGWVPTSTNDQYTSANSDYQSRLELYDGLQIHGSGASVTSGQTVTWKQVADFKPGAIKLYTSGGSNSEKLRITSTGRFGFNRTAPHYAMHLSPAVGETRIDLHMTNDTTGHNAGDGVQFGYQNTAGAYIWNFENTDIYFGTNNNPRLYIRASTGHLEPNADGSQNLGASNKRWANVYSADLQLSNIGTGGNEVDGTEGKWTLQEAEDTVYMINRISGKRYKIKMEEV